LNNDGEFVHEGDIKVPQDVPDDLCVLLVRNRGLHSVTFEADALATITWSSGNR